MFPFSKRKREPGWLAVCARENSVEFAHILRPDGGRPVLTQWSVHDLPAASAGDAAWAGMQTLFAAKGFNRFQCTTPLPYGEYQFVQVEAPQVPEAEMKEALRWKLKDLVDLPVETSVFDILPIPEGVSAGRAHQLYLAIAAETVVAPLVQRFQASGLSLEAIDIAELAQRNVAELFETENRGLAFLAFGQRSALLTFTFRGELFAFRRIEIGGEQLLEAQPERRQQLVERVVLELQRSMDAVDRQFSAISLSRLLVALPPDCGLEEQFADNLYIPFVAMNLAEVIDISAVPELASTEAQRTALLSIGAALRCEVQGS